MTRQKIRIDTKYLIQGLLKGAAEEAALLAWARNGVPLIASAVVWYEFVCGPLTPSQIATMRAFLSERTPGTKGPRWATHSFQIPCVSGSPCTSYFIIHTS